MPAEFMRNRITQLRLQKNVSECGRALPSMTEFFAICEYFGISAVEFFNSSVETPRLMQKTVEGLEQLGEDDLALVQQLVRRLSKK